MRAAADDGTAMLAPLATLALTPGRVVTAIAAPARTLTRSFAIDRLSRRPVPPDPPPPRA
jgi:hypothetical protein